MKAGKEETIKMLKDLIVSLEKSTEVETELKASAIMTHEKMFESEDYKANVRTGDFSVSLQIDYYNPFADQIK